VNTTELPKTTEEGLPLGIPVVRDEIQMILVVCSGEKKVFHELIRPYESIVYRMSLAILHDEADAEYAAQEAFLSAFRNLDHFAMESRFETWLVGLALSESRKLLQRRKHTPTEILG
jgi:RNA polymerase sigma-70 factor (ECF subfamily)